MISQYRGLALRDVRLRETCSLPWCDLATLSRERELRSCRKGRVPFADRLGARRRHYLKRVHERVRGPTADAAAHLLDMAVVVQERMSREEWNPCLAVKQTRIDRVNERALCGFFCDHLVIPLAVKTLTECVFPLREALRSEVLEVSEREIMYDDGIRIEHVHDCPVDRMVRETFDRGDRQVAGPAPNQALSTKRGRERDLPIEPVEAPHQYHSAKRARSSVSRDRVSQSRSLVWRRALHSKHDDLRGDVAAVVGVDGRAR